MTGTTRGDGSDGDAARLKQPSRRAVLGLVYAASLASVAGCGLRLDLPPPPPPVPTRAQVPDEQLLVAVVRDLDDLTEQTAAVTRPGRSTATVKTLRSLLAEQSRVLTGRLTNDGVPSEVIRPATSGPASGTATGTPATPTSEPAPAVTVPVLAERLGALESTDWAAVSAATAPNRSLVLSIDSVRLAGSALLGGDVGFAAAAPARPALVERTASLVYGFEVVAAQSSGAGRTRALAALEAVSDLLHALGGTSGPVSPAWALPFPATTPKEATRLAEHLLRTAIAATPTQAESTPDARSLAEIATWSARVQAIGSRWGVPLTAFPGMAT